jgi:hypothetical protein
VRGVLLDPQQRGPEHPPGRGGDLAELGLGVGLQPAPGRLAAPGQLLGDRAGAQPFIAFQQPADIGNGVASGQRVRLAQPPPLDYGRGDLIDAC